ncbi:MAG: hypothetical protein WBD48_06120 [Pseudolabrys sp.]
MSERTALDMPNVRGMARIACLKKPFRPETLLQAVEKAIGTEA